MSQILFTAETPRRRGKNKKTAGSAAATVAFWAGLVRRGGRERGDREHGGKQCALFSASRRLRGDPVRAGMKHPLARHQLSSSRIQVRRICADISDSLEILSRRCLESTSAAFVITGAILSALSACASSFC